MHARTRRPGAHALVTIVLSGVLSAPAAPQCELDCLVGEWSETGFGNHVALSGQRLVTAGALDEDGQLWAVCVFERRGVDWVRVAQLTPEDHRPGTGFGRSPGVDGNRAVAGAPYDDIYGPSTGSAYVFEYSGGVWSQAAKLLASDGSERDRFATSVAISGDYVVVGAIYDGAGSAYVFERQTDGTWAQVQKLVASDAQGGDEFGGSVAICGQVILVGARGDDDQGFSSGAAYVFEHEADGCWSQAAKLHASDGRFLMNFGYSVSVSGNLALIGAPTADGQVDWSGAAYVFERTTDGTWVELAKLFANDGGVSDEFGYSVSVSRNVAVVGAIYHGDPGWEPGAAYVFARGLDEIWSQAAKVVPDDGEHLDWFGNAVAVSGNIAVVGTWPNDINQPPKPGKAYIYAVGPDEDEDGVMDACECPGDLNKDWIVDFRDVLILLDDWGCTGPDCPGDADADNDTDQADLGLLLANWSNVCP
ncbi:MAG TPA: FG-GAP repeat protein [Phycisphaerae bacterium]|nr:FG-GAP repeat protein [Phycisphaerae bacterium]